MGAQWFQPELDCVSVGDPDDTQSQPSRAVWFLYACSNKALDLTLNQVSGQVQGRDVSRDKGSCSGPSREAHGNVGNCRK